MLAATKERRAALRRAAVGVEWQVVAAVADIDAAVDRLTTLRGRVLVIDGGIEGAATGQVSARLRAAVPDVLLVGVGDVGGVDAAVPADDPRRLPGVLTDVLHAGGDHTH